jgi:accessory gene regulator protein AgrB
MSLLCYLAALVLFVVSPFMSDKTTTMNGIFIGYFLVLMGDNYVTHKLLKEIKEKLNEKQS